MVARIIPDAGELAAALVHLRRLRTYGRAELVLERNATPVSSIAPTRAGGGWSI
jgi:hypothetical protein